MLSLFIVTTSLIAFARSCSIAQPPGGQYYIQNVQLLSTTDYPDEVLLTIARTMDPFISLNPSRLTFTSNGPWCKLMNVNTGKVSNVVTCSDYSNSIRPYSIPDTNTADVECVDNCDGSTATCTITRGSTTDIIGNIAYSASDASCIPGQVQPIFGGSIVKSFTIKDTIYLSFETNTVGVIFDGSTPNGYSLYDVERIGEWRYLTGNGFGTGNPSIYPDVKVIAAPIPCCLCYGAALSTYSITTDPVTKTQIFTLTSIGSDTRIDSVKQRGINYGLFFSKSITIYDLCTGKSTTFEPDLCDIIAQCLVSPCSVSQPCPYNPNAVCVDDYCGGCNARWFCGTQDITSYCDSPEVRERECPTTTTTEEPTTTTRRRPKGNDGNDGRPRPGNDGNDRKPGRGNDSNDKRQRPGNDGRARPGNKSNDKSNDKRVRAGNDKRGENDKGGKGSGRGNDNGPRSRPRPEGNDGNGNKPKKGNDGKDYRRKPKRKSGNDNKARSEGNDGRQKRKSPKGQCSSAMAEFNGDIGISGFVEIQQNGQVNIDLDVSGFDASICDDNGDGGFNYHVHTLWNYDDTTNRYGPTECGADYTAGHFNPYGVPVCSAVDEIDYFSCEVGDLSGRFGSAIPAKNGNVWISGKVNAKDCDSKCGASLNPEAVAAKSIVFHCIDGTRVFCAGFDLVFE